MVKRMTVAQKLRQHGRRSFASPSGPDPPRKKFGQAGWLRALFLGALRELGAAITRNAIKAMTLFL